MTNVERLQKANEELKKQIRELEETVTAQAMLQVLLVVTSITLLLTIIV